MITDSQPLLEGIGKGMLRAAPESGWTRVELRLTGAGGMVESSLGVVESDGSLDRRQGIDDDTLEACGELREAMHRDGVGTWYNAYFTVDPAGEFASEFDYENPPFGGDFEPELLEEDQAEFPRDQEHLPDWHPSKTAN